MLDIFCTEKKKKTVFPEVLPSLLQKALLPSLLQKALIWRLTTNTEVYFILLHLTSRLYFLNQSSACVRPWIILLLDTQINTDIHMKYPKTSISLHLRS